MKPFWENKPRCVHHTQPAYCVVAFCFCKQSQQQPEHRNVSQIYVTLPPSASHSVVAPNFKPCNALKSPGGPNKHITSESTSAWCFCRSVNTPKRNCGAQKPTRSCHFGRKAAVALSWNYSGISQCTRVASNSSCKYQTIIRPANGISFFAQIKIHAKQSITFWKYFDPFKPLRGRGSGNLRLLIIQRCRRRMKTVGELSHRTQTVESTVFQTLQSTSIIIKKTNKKKKDRKLICSNFHACENLKRKRKVLSLTYCASLELVLPK